MDDMNNEKADAGAASKASKLIKLRVYINIDEDDPDTEGKNVDLNKLFIREDQTLPYYIDVSNRAYTLPNLANMVQINLSPMNFDLLKRTI